MPRHHFFFYWMFFDNLNRNHLSVSTSLQNFQSSRKVRKGKLRVSLLLTIFVSNTTTNLYLLYCLLEYMIMMVARFCCYYIKPLLLWAGYNYKKRFQLYWMEWMCYVSVCSLYFHSNTTRYSFKDKICF